METQITEQIHAATQVLRNGGIVIYPTDTAFGIGCRIDDHQAVDRLFAMRKRPRTQATPVLVSSEHEALAYYLNAPNIVRHLMKKYWPGALTIIARCRKNIVYSPIRGNGQAIGLRMPNHDVTLGLIRETGVPILGPSANFHGQPTPYRFTDLDPALVSLVDFVVPGQCPVGQASTVVDCSSSPYRIVREGSVKLQMPTIVIDSSGSESILVAIDTGDGNLHELNTSVSQAKAQEVSPMIEDLLKTHHLALETITAIRVSTGPGSYTGLRVGIAIANMLGALLGVPVNDLPIGQVVLPVYQDDRYPSPNSGRW